jgi:hypothetical protein
VPHGVHNAEGCQRRKEALMTGKMIGGTLGSKKLIQNLVQKVKFQNFENQFMRRRLEHYITRW